MGREENVMVFEDTKKCYTKNERLKKATEQSIARQKILLERDEIGTVQRSKYSKPAKVVVSKKRSYDAASAYKGEVVCVHNFASATNPGGGVESGSSAQEECLCRCSNLYPCLKTQELWNGFYQPHRKEQNPIHNDDIIYTPDIVVFKTDTANPKQMAEKDWYNVNVITCAAPNLRTRPSNAFNSGDGTRSVKIKDAELKALHEKRFRRILDVACMEGNDVVILGAFGCGAFANKPEVVAAAAKNVVEEYKYAFKTIEFAVYCSPRDDGNYKVFKRVL